MADLGKLPAWSGLRRAWVGLIAAIDADCMIVNVGLSWWLLGVGFRCGESRPWDVASHQGCIDLSGFMVFLRTFVERGFYVVRRGGKY